MQAAALRGEVAQVDWHHPIDLGGGVTPGRDNSARKLGRLGWPVSFPRQDRVGDPMLVMPRTDRAVFHARRT